MTFFGFTLGDLPASDMTVWAEAPINDADVSSVSQTQVVRDGQEKVVGHIDQIITSSSRVSLLLDVHTDKIWADVMQGLYVGLIADNGAIHLTDNSDAAKASRPGELLKLIKSDDLIKGLIAAENKKIEDLAKLQKSVEEVSQILKRIEDTPVPLPTRGSYRVVEKGHQLVEHDDPTDRGALDKLADAVRMRHQAPHSNQEVS